MKFLNKSNPGAEHLETYHFERDLAEVVALQNQWVVATASRWWRMSRWRRLELTTRRLKRQERENRSRSRMTRSVLSLLQVSL